MSRQTSTAYHELAHLSLWVIVPRLLGALTTLWRGDSRKRAAGLGRELRHRTVGWFTRVWGGIRSTLGRLPESVARRRAESVGHQHLRCMRWLVHCSASDDDSHSMAA